MANLNKPETATTTPATGTTNQTVGTISVNVGVPGNIKKLVLEGESWTVKSILEYAAIDANGYDVRVSGQPAGQDSPVTDGQTVLLLRPVRGNVDLGKPADGGTVSVNVGVPGNIKKLVLEGNNWTVKSVLEQAQVDATGYDIRVSGQPASLTSAVTDGQTVLLLRPVRGNVDLGKPADGGTVSVNVGVPGNIKKLVLEGNNWTVKSVLEQAQVDATGYDIRVSGQPASLTTAVTDGQTVLLLRPVRGNVDLGKPADGGTVSVNVGVPGNIKKLVLEGNNWTVKSVLEQAQVDATGYDIRVSGQPASLTTAVTDGQTVLLLRPVRGNS